ncbi:MAG: 3'(2'),5'-bisphosphate nucleotidase CysQ [Myxococcota bacterium]|nr:3'(2'),5'-bisphosphate nucleotidase CysQ [Myxococcota bacterium]
MHRESLVEAALGRDAAVASGLALKAGALIRRLREAGVEVSSKPDDSVVTQVDLASDRLIRAGLQEAFPEDGLLSEETDGLLEGVSGRTWVVDPLDGTRGFVNGTDGYAVHIGLLERSTPTLGVVYQPGADRLWAARQGAGAWRFDPEGGARCSSLEGSARQGDRQRLVSSSRMPESRRRAVADALRAEDLGVISSVGVKIGLLVDGDAEVYVSDHTVSYWDSCAPLVILQEAGGRVTMSDSRPFTYDLKLGDWAHGGSFVASAARGHEEVFQAVSGALEW